MTVVNGEWKVVSSTAKRGEAVVKLGSLSGSEDTTLFGILLVAQMSVIEGRENLFIISMY